MHVTMKSVLAAATLGLALFAASPASANGNDRAHASHRLGKVRTIHHFAYYPRYHHIYHADPYAWYYSPRGYYPDYASQYWVPSDYMRYRYRTTFHGPKYRYYPAWGYPVDTCCKYKARYHPWHW